MRSYDIVVIGAGPGGYVAAEEAARLGKKVAVVERKSIGGTCLNVGCIPSKSYLTHSQWIESAKQAQKYDMDIQVGSINFGRLVDRKDRVVSTLQSGIHATFKSLGIDYLEAEAKLIDAHHIEVHDETLYATNVLLATGSHPFVPPINGLSEVTYHTTDTFFSLRELPKKLVIIGGGVIAVELAYAMRPLGVDVSLLEVAPDILLTEDPQTRNLIRKKLQKLGIRIQTAVRISQVHADRVQLEDGEYPYDCLLVATGRKPNLELAQQLNLEMDESGRFVKVDPYYETSVRGVYAVGDLIKGYQLAHVASREGILAVRAMCNKKELPLDMDQVVRCLYTHPEAASFGMNEETAKAAGYDVIVSQLPFSFNGRAISQDTTEGFVKIIAERTYGRILGAVIVGEHATELIHTLLAIVVSEGTLEEVTRMVYAHPTLSELLEETGKSLLEQWNQ